MNTRNQMIRGLRTAFTAPVSNEFIPRAKQLRAKRYLSDCHKLWGILAHASPGIEEQDIRAAIEATRCEGLIGFDPDQGGWLIEFEEGTLGRRTVAGCVMSQIFMAYWKRSHPGFLPESHPDLAREVFGPAIARRWFGYGY